VYVSAGLHDVTQTYAYSKDGDADREEAGFYIQSTHQPQPPKSYIQDGKVSKRLKG